MLKEAGPFVKATSRSWAAHERLPLFALKTLPKFMLRSNSSEQHEALTQSRGRIGAEICAMLAPLLPGSLTRMAHLLLLSELKVCGKFS